MRSSQAVNVIHRYEMPTILHSQQPGINPFIPMFIFMSQHHRVQEFFQQHFTEEGHTYCKFTNGINIFSSVYFKVKRKTIKLSKCPKTWNSST
jgi:hypothetical protein